MTGHKASKGASVRTVLGEAETCLTIFAERRRRVFGWSDVPNVAVHEGALVVTGEVALARSIPSILAALHAVLPTAPLVHDGLIEGPGLGWYDPLDRVVLSRTLGGGMAVTELLPTDGPVEMRVLVDQAALVRARDGTAGWVDVGALAAADPPEPWQPSRFDSARLGAALAEFEGVPYALGGTSASGLDCSGLVQRVFRQCCEIPLPRHSADQLAIGRIEVGGSDEARLCFVLGGDEAPCHVGFVVGESIVHASRSRARVVTDDGARFRAGARRCLTVRDGSLRHWFETLVGQVHVPESALGFDPSRLENDLGLHAPQSGES